MDIENLVWPAFFSFIVGAFGYFISRFWIIPISRYRLNKRRLSQALTRYRHHLNQETNPKIRSGENDDLFGPIRRYSLALVDLYTAELPYWYRLVLLSRKEDPVKANDPASRLEKCNDRAHAQRNLALVCSLLRLK
jgi:hypothetical protein